MDFRITKPMDTEASYHCYLKALIAGDRRQCRAVFESWLESDIELRLIAKHSDAKFIHGLCPDCVTKYYPEIKLRSSSER